MVDDPFFGERGDVIHVVRPAIRPKAGVYIGSSFR